METFIHDLFVGDTISYYHLSQVDNDATITYYDPMSINNRNKVKIVSKISNALGQEVNGTIKDWFPLFMRMDILRKILN